LPLDRHQSFSLVAASKDCHEKSKAPNDEREEDEQDKKGRSRNKRGDDN
tara:strand:+ start:196 stop:342 length:147 start_codon:yes stop_codon:yes gene_type:complete